jgi:hypothetical protein
MSDPRKPTSNADPRHGKNPGYAENQPSDRREAQQPAAASQRDSQSSEVKHDADAQPDPAKKG